MCQVCHEYAVDRDLNIGDAGRTLGKNCCDGTWNPMSHEVKVDGVIIGQASSFHEAASLLENHKKSFQ